MYTKVVFLLALVTIGSSKLPHRRSCDPEPRQETPTRCSNYKNILYLEDVQTKLQKEQKTLEQKAEALEGETRQNLESANRNISKLEILVANLSSALRDMERMKIQTEIELKDAKMQLERQKVDISSLKKEVRDLVKHMERVDGSFSETETEATFNDTQRLQSLYKKELSHINSTAQELEAKVKARLDATKTELEAKLKKMQDKNEDFSTKLNEQKVEVDEFKEEIGNKFRVIDKQIKTQKMSADQQRTDIDTLKNDTAGMKTRLRSTERKIVEQNKLQLELNRITTEVNAKVAFSATVIESPDVFTGPADAQKILIFDRVFTNIGNAYSSKSGIFTAPVKGIYQFSFMTFGYNGHTSGAMLMKNWNYQVNTWEFKGSHVSDTTSNTVMLELDVHETVNIILTKNGKIRTGVFTGFLVFLT